LIPAFGETRNLIGFLAKYPLIVDPSNGQIPPLTLVAQKAAVAEREFRLALLQATETCKNKLPACNGGK
jgi:hypothetical protein